MDKRDVRARTQCWPMSDYTNYRFSENRTDHGVNGTRAAVCYLWIRDVCADFFVFIKPSREPIATTMIIGNGVDAGRCFVVLPLGRRAMRMDAWWTFVGGRHGSVDRVTADGRTGRVRVVFLAERRGIASDEDARIWSTAAK